MSDLKQLRKQRATLASQKKPRNDIAKRLKLSLGSSRPQWYGHQIPNLAQTHNMLSLWRQTIDKLNPLLIKPHLKNQLPQSVLKDARDISDAIADCSISSPCKSPLCPRCRTRKQNDAVRENKFALVHLPSNHVYFLTVLFPVQPNPTTTVPNIIDAERKRLRQIIYAHRNKDNSFDDVFMRGAFEIDVIDPQHVTSTRMQSVLTSLDVSLKPVSSTTQKPFLVHFHALIYSNGISHKRLRAAFADQYDAPRQVLLKRLYKDKTLDENVETISRYMLKFRTQYVKNIYANSQMSPSRRYIASQYDDIDLISIATLFQHLNNKSSLAFQLKQKK